MSKIVESSLWDEPDLVVKVFLTMLVKKDRDNVVRANAYNIARWARKTEGEVIEALEVLKSPDTKRVEPQMYEGRRIEKVDDGWKILNGEFYQKMMVQENTRARMARAQAAWRANHKDEGGTQAEQVYQEYPKKIGKPLAIRKIVAAIKEVGFEKVMAATKAYAAAWAGESDLKYCPNPGTWFGQHRFNDDPATWVRKENEKKPPESNQIQEQIKVPTI